MMLEVVSTNQYGVQLITRHYGLAAAATECAWRIGNGDTQPQIRPARLDIAGETATQPDVLYPPSLRRRQNWRGEVRA